MAGTAVEATAESNAHFCVGVCLPRNENALQQGPFTQHNRIALRRGWRRNLEGQEAGGSHGGRGDC